MSVRIHIEEDGQHRFEHADGRPLDPTLAAIALRQGRPQIFAKLEAVAAERNSSIDALGQVHEGVPDCRIAPRYEVVAFAGAAPERPTLRPDVPTGLLGKLFESKRNEIEAENAYRQQLNRADLQAWCAAADVFAKNRAEHDIKQQQLKNLFEVEVFTDPAAMEQALEAALETVAWPRETQVSFDLAEAGNAVALNVDLPEIEEMPTERWVVKKRELRLVRKPMAAKSLRELYMRHVHGVGLRLLGEVFATLPNCQRVIIGAYSQRRDPSTGNVRDDYLYSALVDRQAWQQLNFDSLSALDPVEVFTRFQLRRSMSKTGLFKPIEPFAREIETEGKPQ